jgi:hypothetical protein
VHCELAVLHDPIFIEYLVPLCILILQAKLFDLPLPILNNSDRLIKPLSQLKLSLNICVDEVLDIELLGGLKFLTQCLE